MTHPTLTTIEIPVRSLARAASWYEAALGYVSEWSDDHHAMLVPPAPADDSQSQSRGVGVGVRLLLVETEDQAARLAFTSSHTGITHSVLDFETTDLTALHERLTTLGEPVDELGPPKNDWAPRGFGFQDPDGNRLGAFEYRTQNA